MGYHFYTYDTASNTLMEQQIEVFSYPMGDITVRVKKGMKLMSGAHVMWVNSPAPDWTLVNEWAELVRDFDKKILVLPYLPSARGDKDVPSPARTNARFAALSGATDIITLDPHSDVWLDTVRAVNPCVRIHVISAADLFSAAGISTEYAGVIAPDEGAQRRAGEVAELLGVPLYTAIKHRDPATGWITRYEAPVGAPTAGRLLVVDDICDGGATFNVLANGMPANMKLDLWVTHGGFTKGFTPLLDSFDHIYTTDSILRKTPDGYDPQRVDIFDMFPRVSKVVRGIVNGGM